MLLAAFEPTSKETAIFYLVAIICFGLAAFAGAAVGRRAGVGGSLVGLGLGFVFFPQMWTTFDAAF
jgi:membrane associated rhomboid family serine protease